MLVFRCECEHVLGVENEASSGQAGECPSCGRIIRVPPVLVNATGKLRLNGTPSRASTSGALSPIRDSRANPIIKPETMPAPEIAAAAAFTNGASKKMDAVAPIKETVAPPLQKPMVPSESVVDAETLSPLTETEALQAGEDTVSAATLSAASAPEAAEAGTASTAVRGKGKNFKKPLRPSRAGAQDAATLDPAAAVETRIDKNISAVANAAASSKRKRAETPPAAAPKKTSTLLYVLLIVALLGGVGVLYATGIIGGSKKEPEKTTPQPAPKTAPPDAAKTAEKTVTPADTKAPEPKAEPKEELKPEVKPDAPDAKPAGETKAVDEKKADAAK